MCGLLRKLTPDATVVGTHSADRKKYGPHCSSHVYQCWRLSEIFTYVQWSGNKVFVIENKFKKYFGLNYHPNRKAWITRAFFTGWLPGFNCKFWSQNQQVLFLGDYSSTHDSKRHFHLQLTRRWSSLLKTNFQQSNLRRRKYCCNWSLVLDISPRSCSEFIREDRVFVLWYLKSRCSNNHAGLSAPLEWIALHSYFQPLFTYWSLEWIVEITYCTK